MGQPNESANEDISLIVVDMVEGKWTPVHTHPVSESMWVLDGQIQYRINEDEHEIGPGDFVMVPAGVPHAFIVKSPTAKVLGIQPTCECEPFYRGASEPFEGSACVVDFARIAQSAQDNGGTSRSWEPHRSSAHPSAANSRCGHPTMPRGGQRVARLRRAPSRWRVVVAW